MSPPSIIELARRLDVLKRRMVHLDGKLEAAISRDRRRRFSNALDALGEAVHHWYDEAELSLPPEHTNGE